MMSDWNVELVEDNIRYGGECRGYDDHHQQCVLPSYGVAPSHSEFHVTFKGPKDSMLEGGVHSAA